MQASFYPQTHIDKNVRGLRRRPRNLEAVNRILSKRFPSLNLTGLAALPHLLVAVECEADNGRKSVLHHFSVFHGGQARGEEGFLRIWQGLERGSVTVTSVFPKLPTGQGLGQTLFELILLRGNSFTGKEIMVVDMNGASKMMVSRMDGFHPKGHRYFGEGDGEHWTIMAPKLSARELYAVEWYWVNVLHCPAL